MSICLQRFACRIPTFNPLLMNGRGLMYSSAAIISPTNAKDSNSFKIQPNSRSLIGSRFLKRNSILSTGCSAYSTQASNEPSGGASEEKLTYVYENLRQHVPQFFVAPLDYSTCHKDIVFEDRIRNKTHNGIVNYVKQMSFLRLYGHFKYAYVKMEVIKMTKHPEDSTIQIRWRISGITGYRILFKMIQFRVWQPQKMIEQHQKVWVDGFSTIYLNSEGLIVRHIADKVMPDEDKKPSTIEKMVDKVGNLPKLALFVELSADITPIIT